MLTKTQPQLTPRDWDAHPSYVYPGYKSTVKRGPQKPLIPLKASLGELQQPVYGHESIGEFDHDLTRNARRNGEPLGERMILTGQVLDERRFDHDIQVDKWRQNDVMAFYGRPYEIRRVTSFDGNVWTWRYKSVNERRLLHIYIDPAGVVRRYHTGDDLDFDRLRR